MATQLKVKDGAINRHDRVDHAEGDKLRRQHRDMVELGKRRDSNNPFNESFTFSIEEYALLSKINPALKDADPHRRAKAWRDFANSSVGKAFRVK